VSMPNPARIKLSDYLAQALADYGVRHVFMLTGGGAMHLNDSLGHEPRLNVICNHHEQACAMAAEGYARVTGEVGVINVTTGPGGINALNGVFGAWTDSIPMLIISGQVKRETMLGSYHLPGLRQLGDQEADIIRMVKGITKYAITVTEPDSIRYHLEKALYLATHGRPGPCWLDVPVDVQSTPIEVATLRGYDPAEDELRWDMEQIAQECRAIIERLKSAQRPVILVGSGVRHAHALEIFDKVVHRLGIPVTTAWTHDLLASDDPLFCGRPGTIGERAGNFVVQNSDTLLVIGSRLNIRQVSYNWTAFARCAYKIQVDVDAAELSKPLVKPDLAVQCDARVFLEEFDRQLDAIGWDEAPHRPWLAWCKERVARYPVVQPHQRRVEQLINPYHFIDVLFRHLADDDVVACGNATACIVPFQTAFLKKGQRLFSNSGSASMGYDLPAAIGAAVARDGQRVICLAGDGSLQLNIQELQTLVQHQLPVKVFVLNNNGYLSIRLTQGNFFKRFIGESSRSGVSFPDIVKIAEAYGLPALRIAGPAFVDQIDQALNYPGPIVCDVLLDLAQPFEPKLSSKQLPNGRMVSAPLEDLYPFLPHDELLSNLFIPPLEG
jgi:acetolactate synthase I/II/III large subunit